MPSEEWRPVCHVYKAAHLAGDPRWVFLVDYWATPEAVLAGLAGADTYYVLLPADMSLAEVNKVRREIMRQARREGVNMAAKIGRRLSQETRALFDLKKKWGKRRDH